MDSRHLAHLSAPRLPTPKTWAPAPHISQHFEVRAQVLSRLDQSLFLEGTPRARKSYQIKDSWKMYCQRDYERMQKVEELIEGKERKMGYRKGDKKPLGHSWKLYREVMVENPELKPEIPPFFKK